MKTIVITITLLVAVFTVLRALPAPSMPSLTFVPPTAQIR